MSTQRDYTPTEWDAIVQAPMLAGMLVSIADPSGPIGLTQEVLATRRATLDTPPKTASELIHAVVEHVRGGIHPEFSDIPKGGDAQKQAILGRIQHAATAVATRSPGEAEEYKNWLVVLAGKTARAAKEGGFLGLGGTRVSDPEKDVIRELAAMLGVG